MFGKLVGVKNDHFNANLFVIYVIGDVLLIIFNHSLVSIFQKINYWLHKCRIQSAIALFFTSSFLFCRRNQFSKLVQWQLCLCVIGLIFYAHSLLRLPCMKAVSFRKSSNFYSGKSAMVSLSSLILVLQIYLI